jgi:hypothetical protein
MNLTVERQLTSSLALRAAYVGSMSRHLFISLEINPSVNTGVMTGGVWAPSALGTNLRRPYNTSPNGTNGNGVQPCAVALGCNASYSQIVVADMTGSSGYNSLQVTLDKKASHGLSFLANFTWSKSIDDMPYQQSVNNSEDINVGESYVYPVYPVNMTVPGVTTAAGLAAYFPKNYKALDHGPSDLDHHLVGSFSYGYELPKVHNGNAVVKAFVNGWRSNGLIQFHTGDVLTIRANVDASATGLNQDRAVRDFSKSAYANTPNGIGNCSAQHCKNWFSPAAFADPVNAGPGTGFGNVNKGSLLGPNYTKWDASVTRAFPIYQQIRMEFKAEYFNALNHTILNNPVQTTHGLLATTFGTITGAQDPRIAQFSLKLLF